MVLTPVRIHLPQHPAKNNPYYIPQINEQAVFYLKGGLFCNLTMELDCFTNSTTPRIFLGVVQEINTIAL